jgi:signal transduction histidine kinase
MRLEDLRRTTTFRLTMLYGVLFALGTLALLGMIYLRSAVYLTSRVDGILATEADALARSPRTGLRERVIQELAINGERTNVFALFSPGGEALAGNLRTLPAALVPGGRPIEIPPTAEFPVSARLIARRLPGGETLVVGRDVSQLREMRSIIVSALTWSGVSILLIGIGCGTALSVAPLQRLRRLQTVAHNIARGDLKRRMPTTGRHDELDMFADTVNLMMTEIERLMSEVKGATEVIAHDLLSPLANATLQLRKLQRAEQLKHEDISEVTGRIEEVLERFRAILRIADLEAGQRRAGFRRTDLTEILGPVGELYAPLAEAAGVRLLVITERGAFVEADPKLLFEAVSNLVDNAIKFAGRGSTVQIRIHADAVRPQLIVQDNGPGIPAEERGAVLQRFYRAERNRLAPGSGLGLNVVTAILRLHEFELVLEDADPGLRAIINCRPWAAARAVETSEMSSAVVHVRS